MLNLSNKTNTHAHTHFDVGDKEKVSKLIFQKEYRTDAENIEMRTVELVPVYKFIDLVGEH